MDFDVCDAFFPMSAGILQVSAFYFNYKACKWSHPPGPKCLMKVLIASYNLIISWRLKKIAQFLQWQICNLPSMCFHNAIVLNILNFEQNVIIA